MRDVIDKSNTENTPLAILSLDQAAAFDRVKHDYLFKTMAAFGVGEAFIGFVCTMYVNARSTISVGISLVAPFPFECGIRQGDPLSGCLYTLSIEPFLALCRIMMGEVGINMTGSTQPLVTTAYTPTMCRYLSQITVGLPLCIRFSRHMRASLVRN